jgi:hypothetical protein
MPIAISAVVDTADGNNRKMWRKYCKKSSLARGELRRLSAAKGEQDWNLI